MGQLADHYRSQLQSVLIEQASSGRLCLCLCSDIWADKYRKVNYLGLTVIFINKKMNCFQWTYVVQNMKR